jgi:hypothetical protein
MTSPETEAQLAMQTEIAKLIADASASKLVLKVSRAVTRLGRQFPGSGLTDEDIAKLIVDLARPTKIAFELDGVPVAARMKWRDETLVGEAIDVSGVIWRVTRLAGMFRVWADGNEPRCAIPTDVPADLFAMMAAAATPEPTETDSPVQLGPDVELLGVIGGSRTISTEPLQ